MGKVRDFTGQRFGRLVAQYYKLVPNEKTGKNDTFWHCLCDCGNEVDVRRGDLQQEKTVSCGCYNREQSSKALKEDLVGQRFGRLIVVEDTHKRKFGSVIWKCLCDCGNATEVMATSLKNGSTQSCGCLHHDIVSDYMSLDITGQEFGKLTAICATSQTKHGSIVWKCKCDCGNITYVSVRDLRSGNNQSCGCMKSRGEQKIESILQHHNIGYKREYTFSDFPNRRFDFYLPCCQVCIEYDGSQHFDENNPYYSEEGIKRDREKDEYCESHSIALIRIPYTDYQKVSMEYIVERVKGDINE